MRKKILLLYIYKCVQIDGFSKPLFVGARERRERIAEEADFKLQRKQLIVK